MTGWLEGDVSFEFDGDSLNLAETPRDQVKAHHSRFNNSLCQITFDPTSLRRESG